MRGSVTLCRRPYGRYFGAEAGRDKGMPCKARRNRLGNELRKQRAELLRLNKASNTDLASPGLGNQR